MKKFRKKGFTLIELIAVLVIMAIIALIVTPLVMSIIKKARVSADKRSIDAYGRSIELAIAGYLLDTGKFPTDVSQLTIEYSGNRVECETTQLNPDSTAYLTGCSVSGRLVDYTYGTDKNPIVYDEYEIGDEVKYNNVDYYVIMDSGADKSTLTLLKAEPLTVAEVNLYGGVGTDNNHVNMYVTSNKSLPFYQTAHNINGYGGMAYYTSEKCGIINNSAVYIGCKTDYAQSEIKFVIDTWKMVQAPAAEEARLITYGDLTENLGYDTATSTTGKLYVNKNVPSWVYNSNYYYWTMTKYPGSEFEVWRVGNDGSIYAKYVVYNNSTLVVRPVIVLPKSALN